MSKSKFSKKIVTFVISANVIFTAFVLYVFFKTQSEPTALIAGWFAFTGTELLSLATIKTKKIKQEDKQDPYDGI